MLGFHFGNHVKLPMYVNLLSSLFQKSNLVYYFWEIGFQWRPQY